MGLPPPEVIELGSSSDDDADDDRDEELERAIALSLEESNTVTNPSTGLLNKDPSPSAAQKPSNLPVTPGMTAFGSLLLDRKIMEEERRARVVKRKRRPDGSPSDGAPTSQRARLTHEILAQDSSGQDHKTTGATIHSCAAPAPTYLSPPFHKGVVKKTWAYGYEREADDIKIEEVLQKDRLKLAVLASYQWDDDWLLSKIDISQTKLVCIAYAQDETHKDQMRANVPSSNVRFCFPPMNGYGAMHAKIQLLKFPGYLRIAIPSGNLTRYDWGETGVLENEGTSFTPSPFSIELFRFLRAMGLEDNIVSSLEKYDFSETKRYGFVHTIPGSHTGDAWQSTGYSGLSRTIKDLGLASDMPIEVDYVCSSLGSLKWEYLTCLYAAFQGKSGNQNPESLIVQTSRSRPARSDVSLADHLRVYFPSQKTVSVSHGGPDSAGTIAFRSGWWEASTFPRELLRDCVCRRHGLLIHSKAIFVRHAPAAPSRIGWAYVGSANLSESAWGRLVKDKSSGRPKMSCRNWECGVILPAPERRTGSGESAAATAGANSLDEAFSGHIPIPMITPAASYNSTDPGAQPWFLF